MKLQGQIESGELKVYNIQILKGFIKRNEGKAITITFISSAENRSLNQNGYYWSVVVAMVWEAFKELGHEVSELDTHEFLKAKFNNEVIVTKEGEAIEIPQSTKDLTKSQFEDYLFKIRKWALTSLEIDIPEPNLNHLNIH
jgi:hypothetical protein